MGELGDALELLHALATSGGVGVLVVDSLSMLQSEPRDAPLLAQALRVLPGPLAALFWSRSAGSQAPERPSTWIADTMECLRSAAKPKPPISLTISPDSA